MQSLDPQLSPTIIESFFELRQTYSTNWIELWSKVPNPFLTAILPLAESLGVDLADISFSGNATNFGEIVLNVLFRKMGAALKITLKSATFLAENPSWDDAPKLMEVFQDLSEKIQAVAGGMPQSQECILAFHVLPGSLDFGAATKGLVRTDLFANGDFYSLTRHRVDSIMTIDKSLKHSRGAFVRLHRTFPGGVVVPTIAIALFEDEREALKLLGIDNVPQ